ncbi:sel1 repeat family protein [Vibrio sp. Isolate31]|uniref:tetratricopeptide repeat protein n=1 Tax=unclassified Vibrio TaxID=2614977 RepID=UPI001EFC40EF|nr:MULTISPECIES: tetratricopeptide repeat protein [unclassified Vibrio]MCG9552640.1 sel1 repeat family protein [Vibrio sp. Isolate32]MCG9601293.1 sel1 repeat family protein [Vibrio sp. Isolate31]
MGIAIGATALSLILVAVWLISLSLRKQRLEQERKARAVAYRKAIEKARIQEQKERHFKAETGHVPSILFLAKEAERNNIKEALYWYDKAAHLDNVNGMYGIVRLSLKRKEDLILREQANFWQLAISALDNDMSAKFEMGKALVHGRGTVKNIPKGYTYIEESAAGGNTEAMLFMGDWCLDKENPDYSAESSVDWYRKAAEKNNLDGKIKLGMSYLNGVGVELNHSEAVYWFETAAEKNSAEAMFRAGEAWIDHGEHGNAIAYIWLFLSAHFGYSEAKSLRDKVGGELGVDAVVGLQALTKPIMTKLIQQAITKHSIIKALNKLYKRNIPIPKKVKEASDEEGESLNIETSHREIPVSNAQEANNDYSQQPSTEQLNREQAPTEKQANPTIDPLDFSQSNWSRS